MEGIKGIFNRVKIKVYKALVGLASSVKQNIPEMDNISAFFGILQGNLFILKQEIGLDNDPIGEQQILGMVIQKKLIGQNITYSNLNEILNNIQRQIQLGLYNDESQVGLRDLLKSMYLYQLVSMGRTTLEDANIINDLGDHNYIYFLASLMCEDSLDYNRMVDRGMSEDDVKNYMNDVCGPKKVEPVTERDKATKVPLFIPLGEPRVLSYDERKIEEIKKSAREAQPMLKQVQFNEDVEANVERLIEEGRQRGETLSREDVIREAKEEAKQWFAAQSMGSPLPYDSSQELELGPIIEEIEDPEEKKQEYEESRGFKRGRTMLDDDYESDFEPEEESELKRTRRGGKRKTRRGRRYKKTRKVIKRKTHKRRKSRRNGRRRRILKSRRH
jgi:hypothetical protein